MGGAINLLPQYAFIEWAGQIYFFVALVELFYWKAFVKPKMHHYISSFIEVTDNVVGNKSSEC